MKKIFSLLVLAVILTDAQSQIHSPWTQYNQVPYVQNAALSGIENFTDIKIGYKRQWSNFEGAPKTIFVGVNHTHALGNKDIESARPIKLGFSGYVAHNDYNFIKDTQLSLSYAVHVPLSSAYYLAMGLSTSYNKMKADVQELIIRDTQDPIYTSFLNGNGAVNYFNVDAGVVLYSEKFYAGYSTQRLIRTRFNSDVPGDGEFNLRHALMVGYNYSLNHQWQIQPSVLYRHEAALDDIYNLTLKVRYEKKVWAGVGVRPKASVSLLTGYRINDTFAFSYSYDLSTGRTNTISRGSHELILGILPFNKGGQKTFFW
ncbi:type IX secretion system membrane protein PorP/SprF [Chryseolinea sp. H1M3-3]|uniref:PorP/SprF family type IX secretion system membrane protein n=1 Tax=Chryseolinea sp. H1M3-3 TaxID=3034144 RepID=UPI0023EA824C|nr:type IX secretion system membrane protein PorP/SprF [Chryseolinea sp. H1M3-3]